MLAAPGRSHDLDADLVELYAHRDEHPGGDALPLVQQTGEAWTAAVPLRSKKDTPGGQP